jgi:hypothetical protein
MIDLPNLLFASCVVSLIVSIRYSLVSGVRNQGVWRVAAVLLTVGMSALVEAWREGSYLDAEGFLHEPFYLIGGGTLLNLAGLGLTVVMLLREQFRRWAAVTGGAP